MLSKLKNIEFLRVILMFGIVMMHSYINRVDNITRLFPNIELFTILKRAFDHSNNGVEGFFIIAGCLLVLTFKDSLSTKDFILKKYIRMSPVILFTVCVCILGYYVGANGFPVIQNILSIFLLRCPFITFGGDSIGPTWFACALFVHLLMYFCILKFVPSKYKYWLIFILTTFGYITLEIIRHGKYSAPGTAILGPITVGNLRAFGGVGLGCFIGFLYKYNYEKISNFMLNIWQKIIVNLIEISSLLFICWWSFIYHKMINNFIYVIVFSILFMTFLFKKGLISNFFEKDIWEKLGKYQYSIFITHVPLIRIMNVVLWKSHPEIITISPWIQVFTNLAVIVLVGIFTYHFIEVPCAKYLKNKLLKKSAIVVK